MNRYCTTSLIVQLSLNNETNLYCIIVLFYFTLLAPTVLAAYSFGFHALFILAPSTLMIA